MNQTDKDWLHYTNIVLILKQWLKDGLISDKDYSKLEAETAKKFGIKNNGIYRSINLIYSPFRVIYMSDKKEE